MHHSGCLSPFRANEEPYIYFFIFPIGARVWGNDCCQGGGGDGVEDEALTDLSPESVYPPLYPLVQYGTTSRMIVLIKRSDWVEIVFRVVM